MAAVEQLGDVVVDSGLDGLLRAQLEGGSNPPALGGNVGSVAVLEVVGDVAEEVRRRPEVRIGLGEDQGFGLGLARGRDGDESVGAPSGSRTLCWTRVAAGRLANGFSVVGARGIPTSMAASARPQLVDTLLPKNRCRRRRRSP